MLALLTTLLAQVPQPYPNPGLGPLLRREDPNVAMRLCNGACPSSVRGSLGEALTYTSASVHTCPNDDGTVTVLTSGQACFPQARGFPTTNFLTTSNTIGGAAWSHAGTGACSAPTVSTNSTDVPDPQGGSTATKLVYPACGTGAGNDTNTGLTWSAAPGNYTFSVFLRTLTGSYTTNVTINNGGALGASATCNVTSAWSRCAVTFAVTTTASWAVEIGFDNAIGGTPVTAGTVYAWGAQVEIGTTPTPLVVTGASAAMGNFSGYGARIRPATTNLAQFYNAMTTAPWVVGAITCTGPTVTANTTDLLAPDGTFTASKHVFTACSGGGVSGNTDPYTSTAAAYTTSIYLRTLSGTYTVNLITEPSGGLTGGFTTCTANATSWTRCTVANVTQTAATWSLVLGFDGRGVGSTAIGAGTVYAWGAQAEQSVFASDVCPTAGATATCAAETLAVNTTPAAFSNSEGCTSADLTVQGQYAGGYTNGRAVWFTSNTGPIFISTNTSVGAFDGTNTALQTVSNILNRTIHVRGKWFPGNLCVSGDFASDTCVSYGGTIGSGTLEIGSNGGGNFANYTISNIIMGSSRSACP